MPYIEREHRAVVAPAMMELMTALEESNNPGGLLNYLVTELASTVALIQGGNYLARAEVLGHLNAAVREYERRALDLYEADAVVRNGDTSGFANLDRRRRSLSVTSAIT